MLTKQNRINHCTALTVFSLASNFDPMPAHLHLISVTVLTTATQTTIAVSACIFNASKGCIGYKV